MRELVHDRETWNRVLAYLIQQGSSTTGSIPTDRRGCGGPRQGEAEGVGACAPDRALIAASKGLNSLLVSSNENFDMQALIVGKVYHLPPDEVANVDINTGVAEGKAQL
eukprot:2313337-Pleurochrysis_carterae.AAC.1